MACDARTGLGVTSGSLQRVLAPKFSISDFCVSKRSCLTVIQPAGDAAIGVLIRTILLRLGGEPYRRRPPKPPVAADRVFQRGRAKLTPERINAGGPANQQPDILIYYCMLENIVDRFTQFNEQKETVQAPLSIFNVNAPPDEFPLLAICRASSIAEA